MRSEEAYLVTETATVLLQRYGLSVLWQLHIAATKLQSHGGGGAEMLLAIADEAERQWLKSTPQL